MSYSVTYKGKSKANGNGHANGNGNGKMNGNGKVLSGQRVLITRAKEQASALSSELKHAGATVVEIPSIEIRPPRSYRPLDNALRAVESYDWLILTSVNGVEALFSRIAALRIPMTAFAKVKIAAIGPATKRAIEEHGLPVHVMPQEYVAEAVVLALHGKVEGTRILIVRAKVARDVLPRELRRLAAAVDVVEAYETVIPRESRSKLLTILKDPRRRPQIVTFTSSSTVKNFLSMLGSRTTLLDGIRFASIGPVTSATLKEKGLPVDIQAEQYTMPGLVKAIVDSTKRGTPQQN